MIGRTYNEVRRWRTLAIVNGVLGVILGLRLLFVILWRCP
jgi:hypothetical protein